MSRPGIAPKTRPGRSFLVVLNPRSGLGAARQAGDALRSAFERESADARFLELGQRSLSLSKLLDELDPVRERVAVAAGGDGTIHAVANALREAPRTLGVVPLGTRNHFARDAGLPLDVAEAARTLLHGVEQPIDLGELNGRLFVNNASLGIYPRFVRERRRRRREDDASRWSAIAGSAWAVLRQRRRLHLSIDTEPGERRASIVFVGNNEYSLAGPELGSRERLDAGKLTLVVASPGTPTHAARLLLRALIGRIEDGRDYEARTAENLRIRVRSSRHLRVALDGETLEFESPLEFRVRAGAQRLLVPDPGSSKWPA